MAGDSSDTNIFSLSYQDPAKKEKRPEGQCHLVKAYGQNQEQEQVIDKIARSFFARKREKELDIQVEMCGEAP
jgi:hypothetical protein